MAKKDPSFEKEINPFDPEFLKENLIAASLFIAFFESFKDNVVDTVKFFHHRGFKDGKIVTSEEYKTKVIDLAPKHTLLATLLWLQDHGAIDKDDIKLFQKLRQVRNELTHKLLEAVFGEMPENLSTNIAEIIALRVKIEKWWIINIEIPTSVDRPEDAVFDEDEIKPGFQILAQMIFDMLSDDEEKANLYKEEFIKMTSKK